MILPETAAPEAAPRARPRRRRAHRRQGPRPRRRAARQLRAGRPTSSRRITVLAEGTQGHLTGAAIDHFGLEGAQPADLGARREGGLEGRRSRSSTIVHTLGWPLRKRAKYGEFGGSFIYPMGDEHVSLGFVVGLEYRDVELSAHDLLQEFKTHRLVRKILDGGERVAWGAKTITEGGFHSLPTRLNAPGLLLVGESAGLVNVPTLKGDPLRDRVRDRSRPRRRSARSSAARSPGRRGALDRYDEALRASYVLEGAARGAEHAPGLRQGLLHGRRARERDDRHEGEAAAEGVRDASRTRRTRSSGPDRAASYPGAGRQADLRQALVRLRSRATARATTSRTTSGSRRQVPRDLAEMWEWMCPAQVYEVGDADGDGTVQVKVTPSNCVQCGAISAKGGRLTPPEGGSGPEYTLDLGRSRTRARPRPSRSAPRRRGGCRRAGATTPAGRGRSATRP